MFAEFARYDIVRFLDDYLVDPAWGIPDPEDFYPGVLDYYRLDEYGDQLVALQPGRSIELMYYNADLLADAGIAVPATWDEFEQAAGLLTTVGVSGTIPTANHARFIPWLWSRGGEILSEDSNHARFHERPGIDSLLLFQHLLEDGYARLPLWGYEEQQAFGEGEVALTFASSSSLPYYRDSMEAGANDDWGVARVPALSGHEVTDMYGIGLGVLHESEEKDLAAWLFIRWLAETEQTARWSVATDRFPVRISAEAHISMTQKLAEDAQYAQAHALQPLGRVVPSIRATLAVRNAIQDAMAAVLENGADVTDTLQIAADRVDAILARWGPDSQPIPPGGGTLVYTNTQGLTATVAVPAGGMAVTETISYVPLNNLPTQGLAFALVPHLDLGQPATISIHYRESDIVGMDESDLGLYSYDWSSGSWIEAVPCGGYVRDPESNRLSATVCSFFEYALIDKPHSVYLPLMLISRAP
jgi:ABC-type glycerol-3-phosphate transport system substrate-binding protein